MSDNDSWVWQRLLEAGRVDAGNRCLTSTFVEGLISGRKPYDELAANNLLISNARLGAGVSVEGASRSAGFGIIQSVFDGPVQIVDSKFDGAITFSGTTLNDTLDLSYSEFARLDLFGATTQDANLNFVKSGDILAAHAKVRGTMHVHGAEIRGNVDLTEGCFHAVSLISSTVTLDIAAAGSWFADSGSCGHTCSSDSGSTDAKLAVVASDVRGSLRVRPTSQRPRPCLARVELNRSDIRNEVQVSAGYVAGKFELRGSRVGTVFLWGSNPGDTPDAPDIPSTFAAEVDLSHSDIEGNVVVQRAIFHGNFRMRGARVGGDLYLGDSNLDSKSDIRVDDRTVVRNGFNLQSAEVGGDIVLGLANFGGDVSLFGSDVLGSLILTGDSDWQPQHPNDAVTPRGDSEVTGSRLVLTGTKTVSVRDETPLGAGGPTDLTPTAWPPRLELEGFEYGGGVAESGFLDRPIGWHANWLARDPDTPQQPYKQLENALRQSGNIKQANQVAVLYRDLERDDSGWTGPRLPLELWGRSVGYGYDPFRGVRWIMGFVLAGWLAASWMPSTLRSAVGIGNPLVFSIERLIPFPRMGAAHSVDLSNSNVPLVIRVYFAIHTLFGYLIPFYIAAVIGSMLIAS